MRSQILFTLAILSLWTFDAQAQFSEDSGSRPLFGGPGDYVYPVVCSTCSVWQDYRNFAWNQLSINGGFGRTPTNPGHVTAFRIYTHETNDPVSVLVEVTLYILDVEILGNDVGFEIADPEHYIVETHPENGDSADIGFYAKNQGPLQFPYQSSDNDNNPSDPGGSNGTPPGVGGGGGDSPSGGGVIVGGGGFGSGVGGFWGGGIWAGRMLPSRNYCGPGTEYRCITP